MQPQFVPHAAAALAIVAAASELNVCIGVCGYEHLQVLALRLPDTSGNNGMTQVATCSNRRRRSSNRHNQDRCHLLGARAITDDKTCEIIAGTAAACGSEIGASGSRCCQAHEGVPQRY